MSIASDMVNTFDNDCKDILNQLLPIKAKPVSAKAAPPGNTHDVHHERAKSRKLEKTWR